MKITSIRASCHLSFYIPNHLIWWAGSPLPDLHNDSNIHEQQHQQLEHITGGGKRQTSIYLINCIKYT